MKPGSRSVSRIRTFTQDVENIQTSKKDAPLATAQTIPQETIKVESLREVGPALRPEKTVDVLEERLPKIPFRPQAPVIPAPDTGREDTKAKAVEIPAPAVFELSSVREKMVIPQQDTRSTIFTEENDYGESSLESGTIIRETRRKRFHLFPAIFTAGTQWLSGQRSDYLARKPKIPTIEKSEVRASVIQKAAEKSEQAPREDFATVVQHLKNVERVPVSSTLTFKPKEDLPEPSWSHVVTPEEAIPTQTLSTNSETLVRTDLSDNNETTQKNSEQVVPKIKAEEPEPILPAVETIRATQSPSLSAYDEAIPTMVQPEKSVATDIGKQAVYSPQNEQRNYKPLQTASSASELERFPLSLLIGVIIAMTLSGAAVSYIFLGHRTNTAQQTATEKAVIPVASLLHTQSKIALPLPTDRITFLQSILTAVKQSQDVIQIYPVVSGKGTPTPAPVEETLQSLSWIIPDSFSRSIKEIDFGGIDGTDPYIVIRSSTFDIAFSGMLQWETYMSADLDPLFGPIVTRTFDPTAVNTPGVHFKDAIASNKNVRILFDDQGKDRIVYTFTDQNTILITTTRVALDKLLERMQ